MYDMRRMILGLCYIFFAVLPIMAQENEDVRNIAKLMDVEAEELGEDDVERLTALLKRPVLLNIASESELYSCGVFTRYQVASLMDYRARSGSCLSFMELAALNGFGEDFVSRIRPFVSLESLHDPSGRARHEFTERLSYRYTPGTPRYGYTSRYKFNMGEMMKTSLSCNRSLDAEKVTPDALCASFAMRLRKLPLSFVAGDFNARFGQGLNLWTGSNFTSFNTPSSFMKRSFGVTPSTSFTGSNVLTGAAAEYIWDRCTFTAFVAMPGIKSARKSPEKVKLMPAANFTYGWKDGQVGLTHYLEFAGLSSELYIPAMKTSCDFAICHKGVDIFSELMFDWTKQKISAVAGLVSPIGDGSNMAVMLRTMESEYNLNASGSLKRKRLDGSVSTDLALYTVPKVETQDRSLQFKFHTQWLYRITDSWQMNVRLTERIRSWGQMFRTDLRSDLAWNSNVFSLMCRFNVLHCKNLAWLTYLEGGARYRKLAAYLRQGFFVIDNWDDRIYAYERDVPGAYNSPAFYGRGIWTSFLGSLKPTGWCKICLRTGLTLYPFMQEKKPGKAELRFQCVFDF